jgi:folate-dependent tRNA-U54 methylase TrmFO/GidA
MHVNYGLFPPLAGGGRRVPKRDRNERLSARALADMAPWIERVRPA